MAKAMSFSLRWGSSCGTPFDKNKFCDEHREWDYLRPYLNDRIKQPWTTFTVTNDNDNENKMNKKNKTVKNKGGKKNRSNKR
jgi:hypothetical protein